MYLVACTLILWNAAAMDMNLPGLYLTGPAEHQEDVIVSTYNLEEIQM